MGGGAVGGTVSKEFEDMINSKFDDCYASIETNKETIEQLKQEIGGVRNDMLTKLTGAAMASPSGPSKAEKKAQEAATDAVNKKIKEIEQEIANMKNKF